MILIRLGDAQGDLSHQCVLMSHCRFCYNAALILLLLEKDLGKWLISLLTFTIKMSEG